METTADVPTGACASCPHTLTNPEALPPETVAGYQQHQLGCLHYRQGLTAQGAAFAQDTRIVLTVAGHAQRVTSLTLDYVAGIVEWDGQRIELTYYESRLLALFMQRPNQTCDYEMIFRKVWSLEADPGTNIVEQHIRNLRQKLETVHAKPVIRSVYGVGYTLVE